MHLEGQRNKRPLGVSTEPDGERKPVRLRTVHCVALTALKEFSALLNKNPGACFRGITFDRLQAFAQLTNIPQYVRQRPNEHFMLNFGFRLDAGWTIVTVMSGGLIGRHLLPYRLAGASPSRFSSWS